MRPELLAPAGSPEALRAAVQNGADAVYLGWGAFNARRGAKNFSDEEFAAALFPTGLTKDLSDPSALIHGIASALGFFALLFLPLWRALLALETDSPVMAWACFAALGLALVFFTLFVLSDKDRFQGTAVAREGLWEQLCLAAMYVPLLLDAIVHLVSAPELYSPPHGTLH